MNFETKALGWVANLRDHFNTLCAEADALVPQEPIEFVRNQLLTAGETLEQFCAEFLQDSVGCLKKKSPVSPSHALLSKSGGDYIETEIKKPEPSDTVEGVHCDDKVNPEKTEQIDTIAEDHFPPETGDSKTLDNEVTFSTEAIHSSGLLEGKVALDSYSQVDLSSSALEIMEYLKETGQIGNFAEDRFAPEPGYCKTPDDELSSSTEAVHSYVLSEGKEDGDSYGSELSGGLGFTRNPNERQMLDEILDKFCSDFEMEKSSTHLLGAVSATEWEKVDEDQCGSDWEII